MKLSNDTSIILNSTSNIYKYIKNINMDIIIYILFIYKYIKKNK